jgi:hypothetical protein
MFRAALASGVAAFLSTPLALAQSAAFPDLSSAPPPAVAAPVAPAPVPPPAAPVAPAPIPPPRAAPSASGPSPALRVRSMDAPALMPAPAYGPSYGSAPRPEPDGGVRIERGPATTPLIVGALAIGIPYATGMGIAASEGFANGSGWLALPAAGPWLALSARRDPCEGLNQQTELDGDVGRCVAEPLVRGMLVLDGVLQATGSVLLIVGASTTEERLVVDKPKPRVVALPTRVGGSGYGMGVVGTF